MKNLLLVLVFLLLFSAGCSQSLKGNDAVQNNKGDITNSTVQNNLPKETEMKITMTSEKSTYPASTEKVGITITNNTSVEYYTGGDYSIEFFNGSAWKKIPLEFISPDIDILLSPHEAREFSVYLHPEQYNYAPGKYRIRKTVWSADEKYDLTCEFNIDA